MDEAKLKLIFEAMQGITYLDWEKLKHCIDVRFSADARAVANKTLLADTAQLVEDYRRKI